MRQMDYLEKIYGGTGEIVVPVDEDVVSQKSEAFSMGSRVSKRSKRIGMSKMSG